MDATYRVSEIFRSIQGEGPSAGTPAHFIRLQGCGVGCHWCDTKYSWDAEAGREIPAGHIWSEARGLGEAPLMVVTGGEPLEHAQLARLLEEGLELWPRIEVETSGIAPPPLSHPRLFYNVSPKLPSATPGWARSWRASADWVAEANATFKIVVGDPPDPDDAVRLVAEHRIPAARVMLMPEGLTDDRVRAHALALTELCKRWSFRMSPRLQVWMWGARRGM